MWTRWRIEGHSRTDSITFLEHDDFEYRVGVILIQLQHFYFPLPSPISSSNWPFSWSFVIFETVFDWLNLNWDEDLPGHRRYVVRLGHHQKTVHRYAHMILIAADILSRGQGCVRIHATIAAFHPIQSLVTIVAKIFNNGTSLVTFYGFCRLCELRCILLIFYLIIRILRINFSLLIEGFF